VISEPATTTQVAPTILKALRLDPVALKAVTLVSLGISRKHANAPV